ncbi:amino acid transporter [Lophiostoma macrostomum CBS 122681]|uniref:Amino acid transporter n=1 Tax=Lophiostoma macrostomum CBS 122681 TaxID=1314788 RepID=A0A6A6SVR3_9PLEO|nr:amino acid transporter [Lophiostoma macrostomum CBS 122681]
MSQTSGHQTAKVLHHTTSADMQTDELAPPVLKKKFNFLTALGIALCCSGAWEGWAASMAPGLAGGGAVGMFWGWIFVSVGICFLASSLAEFASMWPSAGGQYVWVAHLAPPKWSRIMSWHTAWISLTGLWLGAISCAMGVAVQVQAYVATARSYEPKNWHAILITYSCMLIFILINTLYVKGLHYMNSGLGFFIVIGVLAGCTNEKHDAKYVFTHFENNTGWNSDAVAWCVGLLPALYAFFSLDAASHFSEEIESPEIAVPRALLAQAFVNGISNIPFIIAVLFTLGDPAEVLASNIGLLSPFTQILLNGTGKAGVAIFLNGISTTIAFAAGVDLWGAGGRAIWSLSRDGALPPIFSHIHPKLGVPIQSLLVLAPPSIPIVLIYNWNSTAFYGIMSGVLVAFQISYIVPVALSAFYARRHSGRRVSAFSMGKIGWIVDVVAFVFSLFMIIMMSFPTYQPVSGSNMNYACVIIGAAIVFATVLWYTYGRRHYSGPSELLEGSRAENIVGSSDDAKDSV